ncbi:retrovirus-related Pol polyprotein from transposon opus [Nephila pilipes]|uniref:Retrovirus-related Pol polyprotein from transposon opus n=1 Tax=Nephila pilipes TaxID=299642 RepID=A0A8X6TMV9_NEPPI|nr:retrovirus-related Pol polyprotein from transposon opus [Nephila pilipes]
MNAESHKKDLELAFRRLSDHGIVVNSQKCMFGQSELKVLDLLISPLPEKVQYLVEYPLPTHEQELRRFLTMFNFYRRFLKGAVEKQASLHDLVKNKMKNDKTLIA